MCVGQPLSPAGHSAEHIWAGGEFLGFEHMNKYYFNFYTTSSMLAGEGFPKGASAGGEGGGGSLGRT